MKREIKFRAWHHNDAAPCENEMLEDGEARFLLSQGFDELMPDNYIFMQFTGLKDKNGKEIYEGDVLHIEYFKMAVGENLGVYEAEAELTGVVEFDTLSLVLQNIVGKKWEEYTGYDAGEGKAKFMYLGDVYEGSLDASYQIEVIGNIYENSELLKTES